MDLPVMVGFEESGKWYAIDSVRGKLKIGNNEEDGIEPISFLGFARMIVRKNFCYIYPDTAEDERICEILCTKDEMLGFVKEREKGVYEMTLKGAFYYHHYENYYTLAYIDKMWGIMRKEAFPEKIEL